MTEPIIIFVFGSNLAGRHGRGAALFARRHYGAVYGQGTGRTGNAYAIPTKDGNLHVLSIEEIRSHVTSFVEYATAHPELTFKLTRVGCGLAGYKDSQIAPLFKGIPTNVLAPDEWIQFL